jgi:hypothetical protein
MNTAAIQNQLAIQAYYNSIERHHFYGELASDPELVGWLGLGPPVRSNPGSARPNSSTLRLGDTGSAVKSLQKDLQAYDLDVPVSGTYDAATKDAVMWVQKAKGLPATGEADKATQTAIKGDSGGGALSAGLDFATGLTQSFFPQAAAPVAVESVVPVSTGPNWWLIGGAVFGVVVLGGMAVLVLRR